LVKLTPVLSGVSKENPGGRVPGWSGAAFPPGMGFQSNAGTWSELRKRARLRQSDLKPRLIMEVSRAVDLGSRIELEE